ncbi:MAG: VWA domain-containing protein [Candidatus Woesearchaeota archaeon]|jgi:Ca-activated chloride channel family protein
MYITFENPLYLWLLFSVPLFIVSHFYFLKKSKSKALKFANVETLRRISGDRLITKNVIHLLLRLLVIFCLVVAVAGTKLWYMGESNEVNYVVALDASASMTAEDIKPSRFLAAQDNINQFVTGLKSRTKLGLVTFSGVTEILLPLSDSKIAFKLAMERATIASTGGTDMPGAIITSTNMLLTDTKNGKAIILISDGVNTLGAHVSDPVIAAVEYAKLNQVIIYTVGIGSNSGPVGYLPEYYNISASYNEDTLVYIANETGGLYLRAESTNQLANALAFLGKNSTKQYLDFDLSFAALLLAVCFLFIEWGLANTLYRRVL